MVLFALNITVFVMGREERNRGFEELGRALEQEKSINELKTNIHDFQRELSLLSGVFSQAMETVVETPPEILALGDRLHQIRPKLNVLVRGAGASSLAADLAECDKLLASWTLVIENFSSEPTAAITELSVTAEPLSQSIIETLLPRLVREEQERAARARENFHAASQTNDRIAFITFIVSAVLAAGMAYKISTYVTQGLARLKKGAVRLGMGELEHRIEVKTTDELGALGEAFNKMAERRKVIEDQMRQNQRRYVRQQAALKALARNGEFGSEGVQEYLKQVNELLARTIECSRVIVWRFSRKRDLFSSEDLYRLQTDTHELGAQLVVGEYPVFFHALNAGDILVIDDVSSDVRTREMPSGYFAAAGIGALMYVPIHGDDGVSRVLGVEHAGTPRKWLPDEQTFLIGVSHLAAQALGRAELHRVKRDLDRARGTTGISAATMAAPERVSSTAPPETQPVGRSAEDVTAPATRATTTPATRDSAHFAHAAPQTGATRGLIDEEALWDRLDGDPGFLNRLVTASRDDAAAHLARIRAGLTGTDTEAAIKAARTLKGMLCYFQAPSISDHAAALVTAARKNDAEEIRSRCDILEDSLPELFAGLKRLQAAWSEKK